MDIKSLNEKKASIEQQFNALTKSNTELQADNQKNNEQIEKNNQELLALVGENRYNEELITKAKEKK